ncbi:unnamed protein product [Prorocentrum cordatum]|uniref:Uncharacterized protein n=1 Tax=Prorocentrum cordatum TaxID=2364126 RepID=A0ABN9XLV8_9DINO|nr:unnamed protein product [Polarella glacialis]
MDLMGASLARGRQLCARASPEPWKHNETRNEGGCPNEWRPSNQRQREIDRFGACKACRLARRRRRDACEAGLRAAGINTQTRHIVIQVPNQSKPHDGHQSDWKGDVQPEEQNAPPDTDLEAERLLGEPLDLARPAPPAVAYPTEVYLQARAEVATRAAAARRAEAAGQAKGERQTGGANEHEQEDAEDSDADCEEQLEEDQPEPENDSNSAGSSAIEKSVQGQDDKECDTFQKNKAAVCAALRDAGIDGPNAYTFAHMAALNMPLPARIAEIIAASALRNTGHVDTYEAQRIGGHIDTYEAQKTDGHVKQNEAQRIGDHVDTYEAQWTNCHEKQDTNEVQRIGDHVDTYEAQWTNCHEKQDTNEAQRIDDHVDTHEAQWISDHVDTYEAQRIGGHEKSYGSDSKDEKATGVTPRTRRYDKVRFNEDPEIYTFEAVPESPETASEDQYDTEDEEEDPKNDTENLPYDPAGPANDGDARYNDTPQENASDGLNEAYVSNLLALRHTAHQYATFTIVDAPSGVSVKPWKHNETRNEGGRPNEWRRPSNQRQREIDRFGACKARRLARRRRRDACEAGLRAAGINTQTRYIVIQVPNQSKPHDGHQSDWKGDVQPEEQNAPPDTDLEAERSTCRRVQRWLPELLPHAEPKQLARGGANEHEQEDAEDSDADCEEQLGEDQPEPENDSNSAGSSAIEKSVQGQDDQECDTFQKNKAAVCVALRDAGIDGPNAYTLAHMAALNMPLPARIAEIIAASALQNTGHVDTYEAQRIGGHIDTNEAQKTDGHVKQDTNEAQRIGDHVDTYEAQWTNCHEKQDTNEAQRIGDHVDTYEAQWTNCHEKQDTNEAQRIGDHVDTYEAQWTNCHEKQDTNEAQRIGDHVDTYEAQWTNCHEKQDTNEAQRIGDHVDTYEAQWTNCHEKQDTNEAQRIGDHVDTHEAQWISDHVDTYEAQRIGGHEKSYGSDSKDEKATGVTPRTRRYDKVRFNEDPEIYTFEAVPESPETASENQYDTEDEEEDPENDTENLPYDPAGPADDGDARYNDAPQENASDGTQPLPRNMVLGHGSDLNDGLEGADCVNALQGLNEAYVRNLLALRHTAHQ